MNYPSQETLYNCIHPVCYRRVLLDVFSLIFRSIRHILRRLYRFQWPLSWNRCLWMLVAPKKIESNLNAGKMCNCNEYYPLMLVGTKNNSKLPLTLLTRTPKCKYKKVSWQINWILSILTNFHTSKWNIYLCQLNP